MGSGGHAPCARDDQELAVGERHEGRDERPDELGARDPGRDVPAPRTSPPLLPSCMHSPRAPAQQPNVSLFHNYANETASFLDASSTALLAATVYRLALLAGVHTHLPLAEQCRRALSGAGAPDVWGTGNGAGPASTASFASASASGSASARSNGTAASSTPYNASSPTSTASASASTATAPSISVSVSSYYPAAPAASAGAGLAHFSPEMWLTPVVDPYDWSVQGGSSPEGQAFVVEMYAAWRDWVEAGAPGASAARRLGVSAGGCGWWVWVAVGAAGVVMGWGVGV